MTRKICFLILVFFLLRCSSDKAPEEKSSAPVNDRPVLEGENIKQSEINGGNYEQISCPPSDCINLDYVEYNELDDKISDLMSQKAGRVLIKMKAYNLRLNDDELEPVVAYLRELSKRDGRVSIEPYYMGERGVGTPPIPLLKNVGFLGYDIYGRISRAIKYRHTDNYNAKVLFHPKSSTIVMVFFVHKMYGDVCNTIYANCMEIEYLDDDTFDLSLSTALKESKANKRPVKINFRQTPAKLPDSTLSIDNMKETYSSSRLYKWLVVTGKTEKKAVKRDRFLGVSAVVTLIDYSLTLYDTIKSIQMYSPAVSTRAEVIYTGEEWGGKIQTVVFYPEEEKKEQ